MTWFYTQVRNEGHYARIYISAPKVNTWNLTLKPSWVVKYEVSGLKERRGEKKDGERERLEERSKASLSSHSP